MFCCVCMWGGGWRSMCFHSSKWNRSTDKWLAELWRCSSFSWYFVGILFFSVFLFFTIEHKINEFQKVYKIERWQPSEANRALHFICLPTPFAYSFIQICFLLNMLSGRLRIKLLPLFSITVPIFIGNRLKLADSGFLLNKETHAKNYFLKRVWRNYIERKFSNRWPNNHIVIEDKRSEVNETRKCD